MEKEHQKAILDALEEFLASVHKLELAMTEAGVEVPEYFGDVRRHYQSVALLMRSQMEL